MMRGKVECIEMTEEELERLLEHTRQRMFTEEDAVQLEAIVGSYQSLWELVADEKMTLRKLRELLLRQKQSETTKKVLERAGLPSTPDSPTPDVGAPSDSGPASDKKPPAPGHGRNGVSAYRRANKVPVSHATLRSGARCPKCPKGKVYGKKEPSCIVRVIGQAPLQATVYELQQLRCNLCGEVFTAEPPAGVGKEKYDASASGMVALLKYGTGMPFFRLEMLQQGLGTPLPAATQWDIVAGASQPLRPVFAELVRQAAQGEILHNDDTSMRILSLIKENQKRDPKKERTGIFTTGIVAKADGRRIALFFTGRNHAGENLFEVLKKRAAHRDPPIQMCDGLDRNLPKELEVIVSNCVAHGRRHFVDVFESFPVECRHVLETLGVVFHNDALAREQGLDPQQRLAFHQRESAPVMEQLRAWFTAKLQNKEVEPNSGLGGAIQYMVKRWDRMTLFLRVAGAPIENNIVERALKKAIIHRKNSLFYRTENGARVGDLFMSLIHTCELNQVDPLDYLVALLRHKNELEERPEAWMPWNYADARGIVADDG